jgi:hypothetical protein
MRRVIILCTVLLLVLAAAVPAAAGKYRESWENDFDDTWYVFTCPQGFDIYDRSIGHESFEGWYDKDGHPSIGLYQAKGTDNVFNKDRPGHVLSGHYGFSSHIDNVVVVSDTLMTWSESVSGIFWNIQVPGAGRVFHEAGNVRQDVVLETDKENIYTVLRQKGISVFDGEVLCEALAP